MSFVIKNSDNKAITLHNLDKEIAMLLDKEVHSKYYVNLDGLGNWFDVIGLNIHMFPTSNKPIKWHLVVAELMNTWNVDLVTKDHKRSAYSWTIDRWFEATPQTRKVLAYFIDQGYTAHSIE